VGVDAAKVLGGGRGVMWAWMPVAVLVGFGVSAVFVVDVGAVVGALGFGALGVVLGLVVLGAMSESVWGLR